MITKKQYYEWLETGFLNGKQVSPEKMQKLMKEQK